VAKDGQDVQPCAALVAGQGLRLVTGVGEVARQVLTEGAAVRGQEGPRVDLGAGREALLGPATQPAF